MTHKTELQEIIDHVGDMMDRECGDLHRVPDSALILMCLASMAKSLCCILDIVEAEGLKDD